MPSDLGGYRTSSLLALSRRTGMMLLALILLHLQPSQCLAQANINLDAASADMARGIQLFRSGQLMAAKLKFTASVAEKPKSAEALTWRGITENELKQYQGAIRDFEAALRIDPEGLPARYNLALSLIRVKRTDEAIEQLQRIVKAQPGLLDPEYNLAILLEQKNATSEAIEHLQAAYQKQPDDLGVMQHLLVDLALIGRFSEAQPMVDRLLSANSVAALQQAGTALLETGQFEQATDVLENLHARVPSSHGLDLLLARAYIGAKQYFKAIELLKTTEMDGGPGDSYFLLGLAYSGAGESGEAENSFERAVQINPKDSSALYHLGLIEATTPERWAMALRHLRSAVQLEPDNAAYGIVLARVLLQQDHARESMLLLQRIHPAGPESAERDLLMGIAQISAGSAVRAIPTLERAVAENPSLALSLNILGFCYFEQGDYVKAASLYRQASDFHPDVLIFAHDAAIALDRSNETQEAMRYAQRALALPAANAEDHYLAGKLFAKQGRKVDAIHELELAVVSDPDLDKPYYLLARTYMQMGDIAQATQWNSRLTDLKQKHERAYAADKKTSAVTSSMLLLGAPMSAAEKDVQ
jgi:tetratricopeptide (TPR) repeat protein